MKRIFNKMCGENEIMKWTHDKPNKDGWWWSRHIIGSIPEDVPIHAIVMQHPVKKRGKWSYKYDDNVSVYWRGQWRSVDEFPTGWNWFWSDSPIKPPK